MPFEGLEEEGKGSRAMNARLGNAHKERDDALCERRWAEARAVVGASKDVLGTRQAQSAVLHYPNQFYLLVVGF